MLLKKVLLSLAFFSAVFCSEPMDLAGSSSNSGINDDSFRGLDFKVEWTFRRPIDAVRRGADIKESSPRVIFSDGSEISGSKAVDYVLLYGTVEQLKIIAEKDIAIGGQISISNYIPYLNQQSLNLLLKSNIDQFNKLIFFIKNIKNYVLKTVDDSLLSENGFVLRKLLTVVYDNKDKEQVGIVLKFLKDLIELKVIGNTGFAERPYLEYLYELNNEVKFKDFVELVKKVDPEVKKYLNRDPSDWPKDGSIDLAHQEGNFELFKVYEEDDVPVAQYIGNPGLDILSNPLFKRYYSKPQIGLEYKGDQALGFVLGWGSIKDVENVFNLAKKLHFKFSFENPDIDYRYLTSDMLGYYNSYPKPVDLVGLINVIINSQKDIIPKLIYVIKFMGDQNLKKVLGVEPIPGYTSSFDLFVFEKLLGLVHLSGDPILKNEIIRILNLPENKVFINAGTEKFLDPVFEHLARRKDPLSVELVKAILKHEWFNIVKHDALSSQLLKKYPDLKFPDMDQDSLDFREVSSSKRVFAMPAFPK